MGIWLERLTNLLTTAPSPVVTTGGDRWGLPLVLARLQEEHSLGWIEATARLRDDPVLQGNALAAALNAATSTRLFHKGLSPGRHLDRLNRYTAELTPLTLAVTNAGAATDLVAAICEAAPSGVHLLLDFTEISEVPAGMEPMPLSMFSLTLAEAEQLAPYGIPPDELKRDLEAAKYLRPAFMNRINSRAGVFPSGGLDPGTASRLRTDGERHAPNLVVAALMRQKRYEEALELAVQAAPRLVEGIIRKGGPVFQSNGQLERLHVLLSSLDEPWSELEATLEWRLVAGVAVGDFREMLTEVDEFLASNDSPELLARRAALLPPEQRFAAAQKALSMLRSPLTLWQAGRLGMETESAITLLQESVHMAEERGMAYETGRNAGTLAEAYIFKGDLRQSLHWGHWALNVLDEAGIGDVSRRVRIVNNTAAVGILIGETLGLESKLQDSLLLLDSEPSFVRSNTYANLASLALAENRLAEASRYLATALDRAPRRLRIFLTYPKVLILLAQGKNKEAEAAAEQAESISAGEVDTLTSSSTLLKGALLALKQSENALAILESIIHNRTAQLEQRLSAYLYSRLLPGAPRKPPADLELPLSQLAPTGLRALSAPATIFEPIWQDILGTSTDLQIRVLGQPEVRLASEPLKLTRRMWEVLLVIALNPHGISDEELHDQLVRDSGEFGLSALRTHVSRLRQLIPISDSPYRLELPYTLDLTDLRRAIRAGELREAMRLARGPVLPFSRTAGIEELRDDSSAELEQAVYLSTDPDVVFALAEELTDDIALWERARVLLSPTDARRAVATARIERLRSQFE